MKRTFAAAVAAVAFTVATPAFAANFILTDDFLIGASQSNFYIENVSPTQVDASIRRPNVSGGIDDSFFFAPLVASFGTGSSITSNAALSFGNPGLTITAYVLNAVVGDPIFDALNEAFTTGVLGTYQADSNFVASQSLGAGVYSVSATDLSDPQSRSASIPLSPQYYYKINITGNVASGTGQYNGNLTSTSVPEPTTWAMMLAGFGLIGFAMRRQRQSHPKVRFAF